MKGDFSLPKKILPLLLFSLTFLEFCFESQFPISFSHTTSKKTTPMPNYFSNHLDFLTWGPLNYLISLDVVILFAEIPNAKSLVAV